MKKGAWKAYFIFSKKERIAVIILLLVIAIFIWLPFYYSTNNEKPIADTALQKVIAQLEQNVSADNSAAANAGDSSRQGFQQDESNSDNDSPPVISLFYFDPNTINADSWKQLGVSDKIIHTIKNYLAKGGHFYKAEDIKKIYGLSPQQAKLLVPYVNIPSQIKENISENKDTVAADDNFLEAPKKIQSININTATAEQWKTLPGIGDILGNRIVKFRNKLGRFNSVDDVKKTYGLSDSVFQNIRQYLVLE